MSVLRILILSDQRPGHYHLSEGIASALASRFQVKVNRLSVRRGRWPGAVLAGFVNAGIAPSLVLSRVYGVSPRAIPEADLVVSAGAETLAANAAVARLRGVPNIFYGSLRYFSHRHFSLVLTSYQRQVRHHNQVMVLKPSAVTAAASPLDDLACNRAVGLSQSGRFSAGQTVALLVGGDGGGASYGREDWFRLEEFIAAARRDLGVRWQVTNSRRTPDDVSDRLAAMTEAGGAGGMRFFGCAGGREVVL